MPIYEFYCADCNTIFNFYSKTINTQKKPMCPLCKKIQLERRMSMFSISRGVKDDQGPEEDLLSGIDETKVEQAMAALAQEAESVPEDDPRQAAKLIRRLFQTTDLPMGEPVEEALDRMEAGEDPDTIEAEMGDVFDNEDVFSLMRKKVRSLKKSRPRYDDNLYEL